MIFGLEIPAAIALTLQPPRLSQNEQIAILKEELHELKAEIEERKKWRHRFGVDDISQAIILSELLTLICIKRICAQGHCPKYR